MTEKESIERCKQIVKDNNEIIKEARKNGDINTINLTASLDNDSIAIETVIQALEQKDKEIQELKEKWDKDTHTLQNQLDLANADRVEKDKIIDLMLDDLDVNAWGKEALYKSYEKRAISILESEGRK